MKAFIALVFALVAVIVLVLALVEFDKMKKATVGTNLNDTADEIRKELKEINRQLFDVRKELSRVR